MALHTQTLELYDYLLKYDYITKEQIEKFFYPNRNIEDVRKDVQKYDEEGWVAENIDEQLLDFRSFVFGKVYSVVRNIGSTNLSKIENRDGQIFDDKLWRSLSRPVRQVFFMTNAMRDEIEKRAIKKKKPMSRVINELLFKGLYSDYFNK
ncbi:hypothetical protein EOM09_07670 [bacterium]|nr:hypothetical protein [bacterium]